MFSNAPLPYSVLLEAKSLDSGGLEQVVATLALSLKTRGSPVGVAVTRPGGRLADYCSTHGVPVRQLCGSQCLLARLAQTGVPHVLMPHYSPTGTPLAASLGLPVISVIHNSYLWADAEEHAMWRQLDRYTTHYIAVSRKTQDYFCAKYCVPSAKVTVVPNGLDLPRCSSALVSSPNTTRSTLGLTDADVVLLCVAAITRVKAQLHLLAALRHLIPRHPQLRLLFVGPVLDHTYHSYLRRYVSECALTAHVRFVPHSTNIFDFYRLADIFALTSLTEGWSLAMTEAMLAGLPLLLTDVGGSGDALAASRSGILLPPAYSDPLAVDALALQRLALLSKPDNLADIVSGLETLLHALPVWRAQAQTAAAAVRHSYSADSMTDNYCAVIAGTLTISPRPYRPAVPI